VKDAAAAKAAVARLVAIEGQDGEALDVLLAYARGQHTTAKLLRKALADARAFALLQPCFCEGGRKCERCRLIAEIGKVLG